MPKFTMIIQSIIAKHICISPARNCVRRTMLYSITMLGGTLSVYDGTSKDLWIVVESKHNEFYVATLS